MPIKHQGDSYRTRKGERYVCWEDVLEGDTRENARKSVLSMRAQGVRAFAEHNDDEGYSRVFIHEADGKRVGLLREVSNGSRTERRTIP